MRLLTLALAGAVLSGCATMDTARTDAIREVMLTQLRAINATGLDPIQLDADKLMYATMACGTLSALGTVIDPTAATLPPDLADWCALIVAAAGPAAPVTAPLPADKPEG